MSAEHTYPEFAGYSFEDAEVVFGIVGPVGTELDKVVKLLRNGLKNYVYQCQEIRVSADVIGQAIDVAEATDEYSRIQSYMNAGNKLRESSDDNSAVALGAAAHINFFRTPDSPHRERCAYIINSLKHPDEVKRLREIYGSGFYLVSVFSSKETRRRYLMDVGGMSEAETEELIKRDEDEHLEYGQRTRDTFHLADFFLSVDHNQTALMGNITRFLEILFGHPNRTPTPDEFAMFMAFSASLRSADLSRQVGAVVTKNNDILSTGANDCPRPGGGLYWPELDEKSGLITDKKGGRDYTLRVDSNTAEKNRILQDIVSRVSEKTGINECDLLLALQDSPIHDITEYGRVVHAEMEAILSCSRNNISCRESELFCTTFPCHNCAKHIVAAGIRRVVYIEPYPKSKALEFHKDAISHGDARDHKSTKTHFEPFLGVGPRRFFDLFSMNFGDGRQIRRKSSDDGKALPFSTKDARLRLQMLPTSYLEREAVATEVFREYKNTLEDGGNDVEKEQ